MKKNYLPLIELINGGIIKEEDNTQLTKLTNNLTVIPFETENL